MADFSTARRMMADGQVRTSDVTDLRIIDAFQTCRANGSLRPRRPRWPISIAMFPSPTVGPAHAPDAQADGTGQAHPGRGNRRERPRPDIGCTTGYSAAIVARLAGSVLALEEDAPLADRAANILSTLGHTNVEVVYGPLTAGWAAGAPYDVILIDGAIEVLPDPFGTSSGTAAAWFACVGTSPPQRRSCTVRSRGN